MAMNAAACVNNIMGARLQVERWAQAPFYWRTKVRERVG